MIENFPDSLPLLHQNDQFDNTPLHIAARKGQVEVVQELLKDDYDVDVDNKNEDERTPCHLAANYGHVEVLKLILEKDSFAIFDNDEDDNTPLHLAAKHSHAEAVDFLLCQGASVHKRNSKNWTALDCAAASGSYDCAVLLLNHDSPVDPQDRRGVTPLHLAAISGHEKVARLLLEHDAGLALENDDGMNALELAIHHHNKKVVEVILDNRNWRVAMKSINVANTDHEETIPNTPMRMLIRNYPDLAEKIFDMCIKTTPTCVQMDFTFVEDTYSLTRTRARSGKVMFKHKELSPDTVQCYDDTGTLSMINHPLMIMVKEKQKQLLKHPLCLALLRRKWKMFGRYVFYTQLYVYIAFMAFLTAFIMHKLNNKTFPDEKNHSQFHSGECGFTSDMVEHFLQVMVLLTAGFNILVEISQFIRVIVKELAQLM